MNIIMYIFQSLSKMDISQCKFKCVNLMLWKEEGKYESEIV